MRRWMTASLLALLLLASLPTAQAAPATITLTVTKFTDTADGVCSATDCSLREAIGASNVLGGATIELPAGSYNLNLSGTNEDSNATGDLDLTESATIVGQGNGAAITATADDRIFHMLGRGKLLELHNLTLNRGKLSSDSGGAIFSFSPVLIENTTFRNNRATTGGALALGLGAGGTLINTHFINNEATLNSNSSGGGAILVGLATLNIVNSTLNDNRADGSGGAIALIRGRVSLFNVSLVNNTADDDGDGVGNGGGVAAFNSSTIVGRNSMLAQNVRIGTGSTPSKSDCFGPMLSDGFNLLGSTASCQRSGALQTDVINADPLIRGPLNAGGATQVFLMLPNSPLVEAGDPAGCVDHTGALLATDQRGQPRALDADGDGVSRCDIGSVEFVPVSPITFVVNTFDDLVDQTPGDNQCRTFGGTCSLRAAIQESNFRGAPDTILLQSGVYLLSLKALNQPDDNAAANGDLDITVPHIGMLTIRQADGVSGTTFINGNRTFLNSAVFAIQPRGHLALDRVTVENGTAGVSVAATGVLLAQRSTFANNTQGITAQGPVDLNEVIIERGTTGLAVNSASAVPTTIRNSTLRDNLQIGLDTNTGPLVISNSTFSGNRLGADIGFTTLPVSITGSTFANNQNTACCSTGIGGLTFSGATLSVENSTFSSNTSFQTPGAGINISASGIVTLNNTTIVSNTIDGGGINSRAAGLIMQGTGTLNMRNTLIAGNSAAQAPDCSNVPPFGIAAVIVSAGHNLIGDASGCTFTPATGDQLGTAAAPINPLLGPLQNNGGRTATHLPQPGSPAIDAGDPAQPGSGAPACAAGDQRGVRRPQAAACDIGSVEVSSRDLGALTPAVRMVDAGDATTIILSWSTPVDWQALGQLELRLRSVSELPLWVRFDPRANAFSLLSPEGSVLAASGAATPLLASTAASLDLRQSGLSNGRGAATELFVTVRNLQPEKAAPYALELLAFDGQGTLYGPQALGQWDFTTARSFTAGQ